MDRIRIIQKLANSLWGENYAHDGPIEAVIESLLEDDEYVMVETIHPDHRGIHYINRYDNRPQSCVARVERHSSSRIEGEHYDWD